MNAHPSYSPRPVSTAKRVWQRSVAALPAVVWLLAIAAAWQLYDRAAPGGTLRGFAEHSPVTLAHLAPGMVRSVHVALYEAVHRGQRLVSMDDTAETIRLAALEKDIERLQAEVVAEQARLVASQGRVTADLADLHRQFAVDRVAAQVDYLTELAADARDRMNLRGTQVEHDIVQSLFERGSASPREVNQLRTKVDALAATVAKNAAVLAEKHQAFEQADIRWANFISREDVTDLYEPILTPLRLAVDVRERDLAELAWRIEAHDLRAPVDGQVTFLAARVGDRVQAGDPLVRVSPTVTDSVVAYLPESGIRAAGVGTPVLVRPNASAAGQARDYPGTIVRLSSSISEAPPRFRDVPDYPVWGRGLVVVLRDGPQLLAGEGVTISLTAVDR